MQSPQTRLLRKPHLSLGFRSLLGAGALVSLVSWYLPQEAPSAELDRARSALDQLYETRRMISTERADWQVTQGILNDEVELAKREIATLNEQIAAKHSESEQAEAKIAELHAEAQASKSAYDALDETLTHWEERVRTLLPRLPLPLQNDLRSLAQSLPSAPQAPGLDRSKRFLTVLFLLTQINKFHAEITVASEVLDLPDGSKAEVQTMYLGVSQAFYITNKGDQAGTGQSGERGWDWTSTNEAAASIQRAMAILANEQPADFVPLPVHAQ